MKFATMRMQEEGLGFSLVCGYESRSRVGSSVYSFPNGLQEPGSEFGAWRRILRIVA